MVYKGITFFQDVFLKNLLISKGDRCKKNNSHSFSLNIFIYIDDNNRVKNHLYRISRMFIYFHDGITES